MAAITPSVSIIYTANCIVVSVILSYYPYFASIRDVKLSVVTLRLDSQRGFPRSLATGTTTTSINYIFLPSIIIIYFVYGWFCLSHRECERELSNRSEDFRTVLIG